MKDLIYLENIIKIYGGKNEFYGISENTRDFSHGMNRHY